MSMDFVFRKVTSLSIQCVYNVIDLLNFLCKEPIHVSFHFYFPSNWPGLLGFQWLCWGTTSGRVHSRGLLYQLQLGRKYDFYLVAQSPSFEAERNKRLIIKLWERKKKQKLKYCFWYSGQTYSLVPAFYIYIIVDAFS